MKHNSYLIKRQLLRGYSRYCVFLIALAIFVLPVSADTVDEFPVLKVGVLQFGTINWEMDTIVHHGLDSANRFSLEIHNFASKNASAVALQSGAVDIILSDLFWVSRQRSQGKAYVLMPTTKASGGVYTGADKSIAQLLQNTDQSIGVAGGAVDKNWLLLQAYAKHNKINLSAHLSPKFGAPPLLNRFMLADELDAIINFWHYNARLEAAGYSLVLPVMTMLTELNISSDVPLLGWVFAQDWAAQESDLVTSFMHASMAAKQRLLTDAGEWDRIRGLTKAENERVFMILQHRYPQTLLSQFGADEIAATEALFDIFADIGGHALMGQVDKFEPNIYWSEAEKVWQTKR